MAKSGRTEGKGGAAQHRDETSKTSGKSAPERSAVELLEQDHREVERHFAEFERLEEADEKAELAQKICLALKVHAQIEEEIFYPNIGGAIADEELVKQAVIEHATVKGLIQNIESMGPEDELFDAKVKVLGEMVKHHVKEEEEELFPECEKAGIDLETLGDRLAERKEELMEEMTPEARAAE